MKNTKAILLALNQMDAATAYVRNAINNISLAEIDGVECDVYEDLAMNGIRHIQMIAIELTKLASDADENYDSVFAAGELDAKVDAPDDKDAKLAVIAQAKKMAAEKGETEVDA